MCCIFTCCGWLIDLVQRLWTFTMSCCISSAVCCVMLTSSMSGIALGYNYSLAEYIDLKETNVSIYLKRGVFDDEIADDIDWRRSGHMNRKPHLDDENLMTGAPADDDNSRIDPLRSGRRLDDSVFEADDQNKYEGSLMKLTAKPVFRDTPGPQITEDREMGEQLAKYPSGSLDQMKAVQSLIDSRRAMGTGSTASPLATYAFNEQNIPLLPLHKNPNEPGNRRMMPPEPGMRHPNINPARFAVPDQDIGSGDKWVGPKRPDLFKHMISMPDYYVISATYPSPITLKPEFVRPTKTTTDSLPEEAVVFFTRTVVTVATPTTKSAMMAKLEKDSEAFNENFLMEGDTPSKNEFIKLPKLGKSSEEEYEDEIKGLPVRKRRSLKLDALSGTKKRLTNQNISTPLPLLGSKSSNINNMSSSVKKKSLKSKKANIQTSHEENIYQSTNPSEKLKSDIDYSVDTISKQSAQNLNGKQQEKTLLDRFITTIGRKKEIMLANTTPDVNIVSAKEVKIRTRKKSFESVIVSSKYVTNYRTTRSLYSKTTMSNTEILNSISVSLNEAGLLSHPKSSNFVKLLQSTLT